MVGDDVSDDVDGLKPRPQFVCSRTKVRGDGCAALEWGHLVESDKLSELHDLRCDPDGHLAVVAALMVLNEVFLRSCLKVGQRLSELLELLVRRAFVKGRAVEVGERSEFSEFVSNGDSEVQFDARYAAPHGVA